MPTNYTTTTRRTAPTPRNHKTTTTTGGGSAAITLPATGTTQASNHTHNNLASLNQINTTPADGYIYLDTTNPTTGQTITTKARAGHADTATDATHATRADEATRADKATRADEATHADKATHATTADTAHNLDNWTTADQRYLSRQHADTAQAHITFASGTTTTGTAQSANYNSNTDFTGQGWALITDTTTGQTTICADNLRLRGTLTAHELIIEQIRAICGALGITQACGKIKAVTRGSLSYHITLEGDPQHGYGGFMVNDLVRCQRWDNQRGIIGYWARVVYAQGDTIKLLYTDFLDPIAQENTHNPADTTIAPTTITDHQGTPITLADGTTPITTPATPDTTQGHTTQVQPAPGDNLVQYGNTTDTTRQAAIYLHANGQGQPAIDILQGINSRTFSGHLTASLGRLPDGKGFGLWSRNGRILSTDQQGTEHYSLNPDGTFQLGQGAITYNQKGQLTLSSKVTINWEQVTPSTLPTWLRTWQAQTTTLGANYVAAPAAAFGTKNTEGQFTGIIISATPLDLGLGTTTTDGTTTPNTATGLWAVANNQARVLIDPTAGQYLFNGNIVATAGQYTGLHIGTTLKGITQITDQNTWDTALDKIPSPDHDNHYTPNTYRLQPINIITYTPLSLTNPGTTPNIYLPHNNTSNAYAYMLQYIGFTLYIINKSGQTFTITNPYTKVPSALANDQTITTKYTEIKLTDGATLIATGTLNPADSRFYWHTATGKASADTPTTPVFTLIPTTGNPLLTLRHNINLDHPITQ